MNKDSISVKHQVQISGAWFDIIKHFQSDESFEILYVDKKPKPVNLELIKDLVEDIRYKHAFKLDDKYEVKNPIPFKYELFCEIDVQSELTKADREIYNFWEDHFFKKQNLGQMTMETLAWQAFNYGRRLAEIKETKVGI
jgi:hypothetical protein